MEISSSHMDPTVEIAVQRQMLDQMQVQGAGIVSMIGSANQGSTNLPGQGLHLDVRV